MAKQINYLTLSYPSFALGQVIDPDEANQNNSDIANKVNEFVDEVKEAWDIADGARLTAESADAKADSAIATSNSAVSIANNAVGIANNAVSVADSAVSTANSAVSTANSAVSTATSVQTEFNTLKPTLEQAIIDANNAIVEIDEVLEGTVFDRVGTVVGRGAFVATEDGVTTFTIPSANYNPLYDDLQVFYKGFPLELNDNYTTSGRNIVLTFGLKVNEYITYRTVKNVIVNPTLTDGAFIKDNSVLKSKLDDEVIAWVDGKASSSDVVLLDERVNEVESNFGTQLADNVKQVNFPVTKRYKQPLVTFSDDDGQLKIISKLKPLFQSKGVPLTVAVYHNSPIITNNLADVLDLQNNHGWEICSHTMYHTDMGTMTEKQIDDDSIAIKNLMGGKGIKINTLVYPYGSYNLDVCRAISKHYRQAVTSSNGELNTYPLVTFALKRISFGIEGDSLETYKAWVDQAIANKAWVIFETHVETHTDAQIAMLGQLIDYVKSKSIPIVTYDKAIDLIGNKYEANQIALNTSGDYFIVDCEGKVYSKSIPESPVYIGDKTGITNATLLDAFTNRKQCYIYFTNSDNVGFPTLGGALIADRCTGNNYVAFQLWLPYDSDDIYRRRWNVSGNGWYAWERIATKTYVDTAITTNNTNNVSHKIIKTLNAYTAAQLIADYPSWTVLSFPVDSGGAVGFPDNSAGYATTYKVRGNGYDRQEFRKYMSNEVWGRYVDGSGVWTPWVKISAV